jgi:transmembrane sensor
MPERETSAEIFSAAADWAARADRGPLSDAEEAELAAWRAADKRRDGAYVRAHAILTRFDRAQALGSSYDPKRFEDRWFPFVSRRRLLWAGGGAIAASAAGLVVGVAIVGRTSRYDAKRGEVRLVALSDGSVMTLNSASKVAVTYTNDRRMLHLIGGEALFDVAKNPSRPFIVDAGDAQVRAVGTSFSVKRIAGRPTEVVVREGVVEVTRVGAAVAASLKPAPPAVRVAANEMVVATVDAPIVAQTLSPSDLSSALAWKDGMIAFKRTPLKVAAEEFARYSDTPIVIDDPEVGDRTITGLFSAYNPAGFAQAAARSLDIRTRVEDGKVHLSRWPGSR